METTIKEKLPPDMNGYHRTTAPLLYAENSEHAEDEYASAVRARSPFPRGVRRWRMLIIEDQPSDVALVEQMLERGMPDYFWCIVDRARMDRATTLLKHIRFDVALLDLSLPDIDGVPAVRALHQAAPATPIIVYSGTQNQQLLQETLTQGARFYLQKNLASPRAMRIVIRNALAR